MDDNKFLNNYQFFDHDVKSNALIGLNISLPDEIFSKTIIGYKAVEEKSFTIDEISKDRHVVKKMDGKGARTALFDKLNLKIEEKDAAYLLYKNTYYYPLGFMKDGIWHASMIGLIYGENLIFGNIIKDNKLTLLSVSTNNTINKLNQGVQDIIDKNPSFILGIACETF
ncbi:MAG: hypothetical protein KAJ69_04170, partial [Thermoplasmatales archaeon]|nr:hypothetical protein [Thermoplasmatales archaeon]